ncbi:hypothetical protein LEP1GSC195_1721 [Leptospira wolbachii serovar Codice str. CDC]|uniref:Uncharacterized protein n=1 Tax=Leptospira wolbachii serovar Codice str. CDC TaxID=1218599 RepID=R9A592_9LEPT|nr:hypothetical protein LEP1GSC195_1721 [Leptospira wolbachii serovar Codice str. CDC]
MILHLFSGLFPYRDFTLLLSLSRWLFWLGILHSLSTKAEFFASFKQK